MITTIEFKYGFIYNFSKRTPSTLGALAEG